MSYRITVNRKGPTAGQIVVIILAVVVILAGAGFAGFSILNASAPDDRRTLCPSDGPLGHVVLVVDKSDPMSFTQRKHFEVLYEQLVTEAVPKGHLLSVYALAENFKASAEPLLELCSPGNGSDASPLKENAVMLKKAFDQKYLKPMLELRDSLVTDIPGKASPILEMLQLASITGFGKHSVSGEKRLILISDMIQNTPQLNMYKKVPAYAAFAETPYGKRSLPDLKDVKVEFRMLLNTPAVQNPELFNFWRHHVKQSGARIALYEPIKG